MRHLAMCVRGEGACDVRSGTRSSVNGAMSDSTHIFHRHSTQHSTVDFSYEPHPLASSHFQRRISADPPALSDRLNMRPLDYAKARSLGWCCVCSGPRHTRRSGARAFGAGHHICSIIFACVPSRRRQPCRRLSSGWASLASLQPLQLGRSCTARMSRLRRRCTCSRRRTRTRRTCRGRWRTHQDSSSL